MQIYFVRHGRTQFNLEHRFQGGDSDSPLVESGILGGKAAGKRLQAVQFEAVYSSPQKRAFDTAQYIVEANQWQPDIQVEPRLREMRFGRWDGLLEAEAEPKTQVDMLINHPERYQPELAGQGETYADFVARTTAAVHDAVAQAGVQSDKPLLMVSHGLVTTMTIQASCGNRNVSAS